MVRSHPLPLSTSPLLPRHPLPELDDEEDGDLSKLSDILPVEEEDSSVSVRDGLTVLGSYHCVYSPSYRVPVLLFRLHYTDGQPLSLEESTAILTQRSGDQRIRSLTSQCTGSTSDEGSAVVGREVDFPPLSAVLHPSLSSPFFSLHPCQTSQVMSILQSVDAPVDALPTVDILAWLSAFGPFVGLHLPFSPSLQAELTRRDAASTPSLNSHAHITEKAEAAV